MLSDAVVSIGGHTIHFPSFYLLLAAMLFLVIAGFLLGLSRGRRVVRTVLTDEMAMHLGRIADTLDSIANRPADRSIAEASRRVETSSAETTDAAPGEPTGSVLYSMFGR
jgi:hypothetical protein